MRTIARVAKTGLSNAGSAARKRVSVFGHGGWRFRDGTDFVGHRSSDSVAIAARGLSHIRDTYKRNAILPRTSVGSQIYTYPEGIPTVGELFSRGYQNYVNRLAP